MRIWISMFSISTRDMSSGLRLAALSLLAASENPERIPNSISTICLVRLTSSGNALRSSTRRMTDLENERSA